MGNNENITDIGLIRIANGCKNMHSLYIIDFVNITYTGLISVAEKYSHLMKLKLQNGKLDLSRSSWMHGKKVQISDRSIVEVAQKCPNSLKLDSNGCKITDVSVIQIGDHCPKLVKLCVSYYRRRYCKDSGRMS
jgi:hypothetical protein